LWIDDARQKDTENEEEEDKLRSEIGKYGRHMNEGQRCIWICWSWKVPKCLVGRTSLFFQGVKERFP
jgi:hypothetical protein